MNPELFMVFVPGIAWVLFALGGTQISNEMPGWKGWRRFILPAVFMVACFIVGLYWQGVLVGAIAGASYSIGYGESKNWKHRALVALAYSLIAIPIGLSFWNLLTGLAFLGLFMLSNLNLTSSVFVWKVCEGCFGAVCGIQLSYLLAGNGIRWVSF
jgi:hypothetical protein